MNSLLYFLLHIFSETVYLCVRDLCVYFVITSLLMHFSGCLFKNRCSNRWYWRENMPEESIFWSRSLSCSCCWLYGWHSGGWSGAGGVLCPGQEGGQLTWSSGRKHTCLRLGQTDEGMNWARCPGHGNSRQTPWLETHHILRSVKYRNYSLFSKRFVLRSYKVKYILNVMQVKRVHT